MAQTVGEEQALAAPEALLLCDPLPLPLPPSNDALIEGLCETDNDPPTRLAEPHAVAVTQALTAPLTLALGQPEPEMEGAADKEREALAVKQPLLEKDRSALTVPPFIPPAEGEAVGGTLLLGRGLLLRCEVAVAAPLFEPSLPPPALRETVPLSVPLREAEPVEEGVTAPAEAVGAAGVALRAPLGVGEADAAAEGVDNPVVLLVAQALGHALIDAHDEGALLALRGALSEKKADTVGAEGDNDSLPLRLATAEALPPPIDAVAPSKRLVDGEPEADKQKEVEPEGGRE